MAQRLNEYLVCDLSKEPWRHHDSRRIEETSAAEAAVLFLAEAEDADRSYPVGRGDVDAVLEVTRLPNGKPRRFVVTGTPEGYYRARRGRSS